MRSGPFVRAVVTVRLRNESTTTNERRVYPLHLRDDCFQRLFEALENRLTQVDEMDAVIDFGEIEERELLLVTQHLQRWLPDDREIQRRSFRRRIRKQDLMTKRGLPGSRVARNQVERVLGKSAAENVVELRKAGRYQSQLRLAVCSHDPSSFTKRSRV